MKAIIEIKIQGIKRKEKVKSAIFKMLTESKTFKYAIEFCFTQAVTVIDKAKDAFPQINDIPFLKRGSSHAEAFKDFRNWILHGNAILDFSEIPASSHGPSLVDVNSLLVSFRATITPGFIYELVRNLLPELKSIECSLSAYKAPQNTC